MAGWFKHIDGVLVLGVELPDGSAATVPAAVTDVFGPRGRPRDRHAGRGHTDRPGVGRHPGRLRASPALRAAAHQPPPDRA